MPQDNQETILPAIMPRSDNYSGKISPKKSLGQNFLSEMNIRNKIVQNCGFTPKDAVLEIGPGRGEMTFLIAPLVKKLICVELDRRLIPVLRAKLNNFPNVDIIHGDILETDLKKIPADTRLKIYGNIPYHLTTPIITALVKQRSCVSEIYLTVQKEFAQRVTALPGSKIYGSFSIYCRHYLRSEIIFTISRHCFYPVPKVDSAFISMKILSQPPEPVNDEEKFFLVTRTAFNQRRKTLKKTLKGIIPSETLSLVMEKRGIKPLARPEELSYSDFAAIANSF